MLIRCRGNLFVLRPLPSNGFTRYSIISFCMKYGKVIRRGETSAVDFPIDLEREISPLFICEYCHCWTIVEL
jgi:hypothetical protein